MTKTNDEKEKKKLDEKRKNWRERKRKSREVGQEVGAEEEPMPKKRPGRPPSKAKTPSTIQPGTMGSSLDTDQTQGVMPLSAPSTNMPFPQSELRPSPDEVYMESAPTDTPSSTEPGTTGSSLDIDQTPGVMPLSAPPPNMPFPQSELRPSLEEVDMESATTNLQRSTNSPTETPRRMRPAHKRRRSLGSWSRQIKRRNSWHERLQERLKVMKPEQDQRFLATAEILQALAISYPKRPHSASLTRQSKSDSVNSYRDMMERIKTNPELFGGVESERCQQPQSPGEGATRPKDATAKPTAQAVVVNIGGQQVRVPSPEGYEAVNPNATLRRSVGIAWAEIARLIIDPKAWYDDNSVWLYMALIARRSGQRVATVSPLYIDMWRQWEQRGEHAPIEAIGTQQEPEIIGIPVFLRPNHWALGIYTRASNTVLYYDTLMGPLTNEYRTYLAAVVQGYYPNEPPPRIHVAPSEGYNRQRDGFNCGPHICLIWERLMTPGASTLIQPLNMEYERLRMLSNLIGAFVADNHPFTPLHANGVAYPSMERFKASLPYYGHTRNEQEESAGERTVPHWRADGIEVDPLPPTAGPEDEDPQGNKAEGKEESSNLSHADAQMFCKDTELGTDKDQIAHIIRQLCETSTKDLDNFAEFITANQAGYNLHGNLIDTHLCMLKHLRRSEAAIVRTTFSSAYYSPQSEEGQLRASDYVYGDPAKADIVLIPIHKDCSIVNTNAASNSGHFSLGMFNTKTNTVYHYDSAGANANKEDKELYRKAVSTLRPLSEPQCTCKRIVNRPTDSYNRQMNIFDYGIMVVLYAELIMLRGHDRTYIKRLADYRHARSVLGEQKRRVADHLRSIAEGKFPRYQPPPTSQKRAPAAFTRDVPLDDQTGQRRIFIFDGNGRPQIVEDPPKSLQPITAQCQRSHPHTGCFANSANHKIEPFTPSDFTEKCEYCDAWLTGYEFSRSRTRGTALRCKFCRDGRNATEEMKQIFEHYQDIPELLASLRHPAHPRYRYVRKKSRLMNSQLKFGHSGIEAEYIMGGGPTVCKVNGNIDFTLADILASQGRPRFGTYYAIDPETALDLRLQHEVQMMGVIDQAMFSQLDNMIRQENWLARTYRTAGERLEAYLRQHGEYPRFRIIFENKRRGELRDEEGNRLENPTDIPNLFQPVIVWVDENGTGEPPEDHGIYLEGRNRGYVHIGKWEPITWPAEYPMVFPRGQLGFRAGLRPNPEFAARRPTRQDDDAESIGDGDANQAPANEEVDMDQGMCDNDDEDAPEEGVRRGEFISMNEFILYNIARRGGLTFTTCPHFLWDAGEVAQTFTCIARNQVEHRQYEWHKKHQDDIGLRSMLSEEYVRFLQRNMPEDTRLGKYIYMPKNVPGGRRHMQESYTKLTALENEMGIPDWFVTATMNLSKVEKFLREGETPYERPDVVMRVWEEYTAELKKDLFKKGVLGECRAWAMVLEHQGRGAPHVHILIWVADCPNKGTPQWVNNYVTAELPYPPPPGTTGEAAEQQRRLCDLVGTLMIHKCTDDSKCMVDGRCQKRFPKAFSLETVIGEGQYPVYRRRAPPGEDELPSQDANEEGDEDPVQYRRRPPMPAETISLTAQQRARYGNTIRKTGAHGCTEYEFDNSRVVPYNPALLLKYEMHINVEYVGSAKVFDYICKYVTKGDPLLPVRIQREGENVQDYDEFQHHFTVNYRTSMQAMARILGIRIFDMSHSVKTIYVHMPGKEKVVFRDGHEQDAQPIQDPLNAYFRLNLRLESEGDDSARDLTYLTVNSRFFFKRGEWHKRKIIKRRQITRIGRVSDHDSEAQALRLLLIHTKAPKSFEDLRKVPGEEQLLDTFTEAARHRGLLDSPEIMVQTIQDACEELRGQYRRCRFFAVLMFNNTPRDAQGIFDTVLDLLIPPPPNAQPEQDREARRQRALNRIEYILQLSFNSSCVAIGLEAPLNYNHQEMEEEEQRMNDPAAAGDHVGDDEPSRRRGGWQATVDRNLRLMTRAQRRVYDRIMESVRAAKVDPLNADIQRLFMIEGPGGVGKTLINSTIIATCKAENLRVLPTASTGIAATLLPGGATAHSTLFIPMDVEHDTPARLEAQGPTAERLRSTDLLIIDEASMFNKEVLEYIDRQLRDLFPRGGRGQMLFGGIPILLTGNWAQLPPVVVGADDAGRRNASIKMSPIFRQFLTYYLRENMRVGAGEAEFAQWLIEVGYGRNFVNQDCITIPEQCQCENLQEFVEFCFPAEVMRTPIESIDLIRNSCILAPKRTTVAQINDHIRELIPESYSQTETLHGFDHRVQGPNAANNPLAVNIAAGDIEYIHGQTPSGMPPYELKLKRGMICIINCNYDPKGGLYNGTRVQLLQVRRNLLKVKILTGNLRDTGQEVYIGRKKFEYGQKRNDVGMAFTRTQFPLEPGFALTINKAQGQTLDRVGIDLRSKQCFSHGMLYTALSRVRSLAGLKMMSSLRDKAVNIVDMELIRGADVDQQEAIDDEAPMVDDNEPPANEEPMPVDNRDGG